MKQKLIKKFIIKDCKIEPKITTECYLYDFKLIGVTKENLEEVFNGSTLLVYKFAGNTNPRRCFYCGKKLTDNSKLLKHVQLKHQKTSEDIRLLKIQEHMYKNLLNSLRKKNNKSFFHLTFTWRECQMCDSYVAKGREGICSIPESSRNKIRSLKQLGFSCKGFKKRWKSDDYGFLIRSK